MSIDMGPEASEAAKPQDNRKANRKIQILPPQLINRIAAGEVVERPASVVKELVENAMDAGATRIDIMVGDAGRTIRVADNGCGMAPEDALLAFYNHATSKIREEADLDRIQTLGFRGEALASIGSIAKLTCLTRTEDAAMGIRITLDEQGEPVLTEAGCAPGTVMEVADLFYNTPARLKFLKRPATELGHIEEIVQYLALSHPEIRFTLTLKEREVLRTSGTGELKRTMEEIFGLKRDNIRLIPITAMDEEVGLRLAGFTSEPGVMKSSKRWMITYVNGRHVKCAVLQKAIDAAYESLLPHDKYPLCVFFLNMPPDEVDVNVHPAKREVRYAAGQTIFGFVRSGIRNSLADQGISLEPPPAPEMPAFTTPHFQPGAFHTPSRMTQPTAWKPSIPNQGPRMGSSPIPNDPHPVQAALQFYRPTDERHQASSESLHSLAAEPSPETLPQEQASKFKVIGQLFNTYILLETVQGLMVVDQHIASERAFFESLTINFTSGTPDIQRMVTALPVTVTPVQRDLLHRYQAEFAKLGFLYTLPEGANTVQLTGYPLVYEGRDGMFEAGGLFENLLAQLEETGEMKLDLDLMIATLSCHSAVRAGDSLSNDEMRQVVERWLACQLPWTCPHGRPIAHTITAAELNKFFHRPSLPVNAV